MKLNKLLITILMILTLTTSVFAVGQVPVFSGQDLGELTSGGTTLSVAGMSIFSTTQRTADVDVHELFGITYRLNPDFYWLGVCSEPRLYMGMWNSDDNSQYGFYGDKSDENGISYYDLTGEWDTRTATTKTSTGFELIEEGHYEFQAYVTCGSQINRYSFDSMKINVGLPDDCSDTRRVFIACIGTDAQYMLPDCGYSYITVKLDPSDDLCTVLPGDDSPAIDPSDEDNIIDPDEPGDVNNDQVIPLPTECDLVKKCNVNDWWLAYENCGAYDGEIQQTKSALPDDYTCHEGDPVLIDEVGDKELCEEDGGEWIAVSSCDNNFLPSLCNLGITSPETANSCSYGVAVLPVLLGLAALMGAGGFYVAGVSGIYLGITVGIVVSYILYILQIIG